VNLPVCTGRGRVKLPLYELDNYDREPVRNGKPLDDASIVYGTRTPAYDFGDLDHARQKWLNTKSITPGQGHGQVAIETGDFEDPQF